MRRIAMLLLFAGLVGGCLPTRPDDPTKATADAAPWAKGETKADEKVVEKLPPVMPDAITEQNAKQMAEALMDEIKRDAANPPKVIVEARK